MANEGSKIINNRGRDHLILTGSRFIFRTNLAGDPERGFRGNTDRFVNLVIEDPNLLDILSERGVRVKDIPDRDDPEKVTYFVRAKANYWGDNRDPDIYVVSNGKRKPMSKENVGIIDHLDVGTVEGIFLIYDNKDFGTVSLFIEELYVTENESVSYFASKYVDDLDREAMTPEAREIAEMYDDLPY